MYIANNRIHFIDNVETLYLFDPELQLINTKPIIKNKFKKFLSDFKKFKVDII